MDSTFSPPAEHPQNYRSGFVNIVGNPNVGKSTLLNYLVGERLSIITSKAQTTRHRILGIVNTPDMQVVYSDTPGVLKPNYKLQERMRAFSDQALTDADVLIYVTDVVERREKNLDFLQAVGRLECPILLVINKIDLTDQKHLEELVEEWHTLLPKAEIDALTDRPARFFVSEIIREKILLYYTQEVPYAVEVVVEEFKESSQRIDIRAVIMVERESQKGIIIGHKGVAIKKLGIAARRPLEKFFDKHIRLELIVRVEKDWRQNDRDLSEFGYSLD